RHPQLRAHLSLGWRPVPPRPAADAPACRCRQSRGAVGLGDRLHRRPRLVLAGLRALPDLHRPHRGLLPLPSLPRPPLELPCPASSPVSSLPASSTSATTPGPSSSSSTSSASTSSTSSSLPTTP